MNSGIVLDIENIRHRFPTGAIPKGQLASWGFPRPHDGFRSSYYYDLIKNAVDEGKQVLYLNLEGSIDPEWLQSFGINNQEK